MFPVQVTRVNLFVTEKIVDNKKSKIESILQAVTSSEYPRRP